MHSDARGYTIGAPTLRRAVPPLKHQDCYWTWLSSNSCMSPGMCSCKTCVDTGVAAGAAVAAAAVGSPKTLEKLAPNDAVGVQSSTSILTVSFAPGGGGLASVARSSTFSTFLGMSSPKTCVVAGVAAGAAVVSAAGAAVASTSINKGG